MTSRRLSFAARVAGTALATTFLVAMSARPSLLLREAQRAAQSTPTIPAADRFRERNSRAHGYRARAPRPDRRRRERSDRRAWPGQQDSGAERGGSDRWPRQGPDPG